MELQKENWFVEKDDDYNDLVTLYLKWEQYMQTFPEVVGNESVGLKTRVSVQSVQQIDLGSIISVYLYLSISCLYFVAKEMSLGTELGKGDKGSSWVLKNSFIPIRL